MAINITQFAPPSRVSSLVWDENMEPPAGKVFEGDLVGDVTGDVTGDLTGAVRGSVLGYLSRNGVVSASSGTLVVPASSSTGDNPNRVDINSNGVYVIVDNTYKCFLDDPCYIPVVRSDLGWQYYPTKAPYAKSYTSEDVLIDSISDSGNLNIHGASYIVLNGGIYTDGEGTLNGMIIVADAYIDAGTSLILGDDTPPDGPKVSKLVWDADMVPAAGKKFKGALEGNVTGKSSYTWVMTPSITGFGTGFQIGANSESQVFQLSPGDTLSGTINIQGVTGSLSIRFIDKGWNPVGNSNVPAGITTFTIPATTNGIYIKNTGATPGTCEVKHFTIT